jgi:hypothetical protein
VSFEGGSATTPAIRADGTRVYVGDHNGQLLAIGPDCAIAWQEDVGAQIIGSVAVSADNAEIYAATEQAIVKAADRGAQADIVWRSEPEECGAASGEACMNLNLVTIGANALVFQAGAGQVIQGWSLPRSAGLGVLDRETGALLSFAPGLDETVAVMSVGPDGGVYVGNSPLRRAIHRAIFGANASEPLRGGISYFRPASWLELLDEIGCAGAKRIQNAISLDATCPDSIFADVRQLGLLVGQAWRALDLGLGSGELDSEARAAIADVLISLEAALDAKDLEALAAGFTLIGGCVSWQ